MNIRVLLIFLASITLAVPVSANSLYDAASSGDMAAIAQLIAVGTDVNARNDKGNAPLHAAAYRGHTNAVKVLLDAGAIVNPKNSDGRSPLSVAALEGHTGVVEALLAAGAIANEKDNSDYMPLHLAAYAGHTDIVESLVVAGAEPDARANDGFTPLHLAAYSGQADAIRSLASVGANLNAKTNDGATPLHFAAQEGHTAAALALVGAGADVDVENNHGATPLQVAAQEGHADVIETLAFAHYQLGVLYEEGHGVKQDFAIALRSYTHAAEQGFADAQFAAGLMYEKGRGVAPDFSTAFRWYTQAAEHGHAEARARIDRATHEETNVPEIARGEWSLGQCSSSNTRLQVNTDAALVVHKEGAEEAVAILSAAWLDEHLVLKEYDNDGSDTYVGLNQLERCTPVSVTLKTAAGEALTLFRRYDQVRATCVENAQQFGCATEVFSAIDIAEDARLSGAELSRALRALLFFTTYAVIADGRKEASAPPEDGWPRHFVPTTALLASSAGSIVLTPLLAKALTASYDYDGDTFLSLDEILQDRAPEQWVNTVEALDSTAAAAGLSNALRELMDLTRLVAPNL